ncbi:MAG TPA: polysaccharide deacetylase family protein [Vicinamibacteria bacterium]
MYHRIGEGALPDREPQEEVYAVPRAAFLEQLDVLRSSRCSVIGFADLAAGLLGDATLPSRATVLTFDDGNATDHSDVLPALAERAWSAVFFITPSRIGCPGFLGWDEVRELARSGMTVGAHGFEHRPLSELSEAELSRHLREARRLIEARVGRAPETLSLPGGFGGPREIEAAHREGYRLVMGSVPRRASRGTVPAAVPRFAVRRGDSAAGLRALVEQRPAAILRASARHEALAFLRGLMGPELYRRARGAWAGSTS